MSDQLFRCVACSAAGLVREKNEDSIWMCPERGVFAVADGMGGGSEGARASRLVIEALKRDATARSFAERLMQIRDAIEFANLEICTYARRKRFRQMGTTVSVLAVDCSSAADAALVYVGDSRVYRLREGDVELLTRDHSVGAELETQVGGLVGSAFAVRKNPLAHILTRAVGADLSIEVDERRIECRPGDRFLVCTDGVHDLIETSELAQYMSVRPLADAVPALEGEILRRGAHDNYSFILIERCRHD